MPHLKVSVSQSPLTSSGSPLPPREVPSSFCNTTRAADALTPHLPHVLGLCHSAQPMSCIPTCPRPTPVPSHLGHCTACLTGAVGILPTLRGILGNTRVTVPLPVVMSCPPPTSSLLWPPCGPRPPATLALKSSSGEVHSVPLHSCCTACLPHCLSLTLSCQLVVPTTEKLAQRPPA